MLNTHSVELDYDYSQIASLIDDQGNSYRVVSWNGGRSGHHLEGKLNFEALRENINKVTLILSGIDNQTHNLTWDILP